MSNKVNGKDNVQSTKDDKNSNKTAIIDSSNVKYYKYIDDIDFETNKMIKDSITLKNYKDSLNHVFKSLDEKEAVKKSKEKFITF